MIKELSFANQSALFARLSNLAYKIPDEAEPLFHKMGYYTTYYEHRGSNVYILEDATDVIIVCRGTEAKEWADVQADLTIALVPSRAGKGKVHRGFRNYTDYVWDDVKKYMNGVQKTLWLTGHSLGAAVATLMARRFTLDETLVTPEALFTYGSPRIGNRTYINEFNKLLPHHRWVNEGDIVTKVPFPPFYYHCGIKHHITDDGIMVNAKVSKKLWNVIKGTLRLPKNIVNTVTHDIKNHSSDLYAQRLSYWALNLIEE